MDGERETPTPPWATRESGLGQSGLGQRGFGQDAGGTYGGHGPNGPTRPFGAADAGPAKPEEVDVGGAGPSAGNAPSSAGWSNEQTIRGDGDAGPSVGPAAANDAGTSPAASRATQEDLAEIPGSDLVNLDKPLEGFTTPAARCINKAASIAFAMNHTSINAAHLVLAMCLDKRAAVGLEERELPAEEIRRLMIPLLIAAKWNYSPEKGDKPGAPLPVLTTTADVSDILEAARRRAAERDNQPATLPDLLDALELMHAKGQLIPRQAAEAAGVQQGFDRVGKTLDELKNLIEQGFRNASQFDQGMNRATRELLEALARRDQESTPPTPPEQPPTSIWNRRGFQIALLGLL